MWNFRKSVVLSVICTKLLMILIVLLAISAPFLVDRYIFILGKLESITVPLLFTIYSCFIPAMAVLICLNRLLKNIKSNAVFVNENVKLLRRISWCCFAAAFILLVSGFYYILFVLAGIAAVFFGLILRVIKNVFEQAIAIKHENDFTI